ncbi:MAG TPA: hypothetical protein PKC21_01365 [Oligoflexia bacterium]|nr:hypothetical protein [Oligoflexia bacterium]
MSSCDIQKKYQKEKHKQYEAMVATPVYKSIGTGYEALPKSLSSPILNQRQHFAEFLQSFHDECLTLIHLYHPSDVDIESVALCIKTEEKNVGIYQNKACVVAMIDHIYQKPMPYYSENNTHWGIQKACESDSMLKKINQKDTLTTVNPITYARMKVKDDGFNMQIIQDRLDVSSVIKKILNP